LQVKPHCWCSSTQRVNLIFFVVRSHQKPIAFQVRLVLLHVSNSNETFLYVAVTPPFSGTETGIYVDEDMLIFVHFLLYQGCDVYAAGVGLQHVESYRVWTRQRQARSEGQAPWNAMRCISRSSASNSSGYLTDAPFPISNAIISEFPL
jgi:hypothetical protein